MGVGTSRPLSATIISGVEEEWLGGSEPPSCDLMGAQPLQLCKFVWNLAHI